MDRDPQLCSTSNTVPVILVWLPAKVDLDGVWKENCRVVDPLSRSVTFKSVFSDDQERRSEAVQSPSF